jgi:glycosyltransferase involved in cell wall biosynthesis
MLSIIIATMNSERALLPTLAALVPGAIEGLVSEAIVADGGSRDDTGRVADAAGCDFRRFDGPLGRRLKSAAAAARAPYLLFVRPGVVLEAAWTGEAKRFIEFAPKEPRAAVFRRGRGAQATLREMCSLLVDALGARPRPEQGLLIAHEFYDALGGHREGAADPERDLIRRIGRRRIATLAAAAAEQDT